MATTNVQTDYHGAWHLASQDVGWQRVANIVLHNVSETLPTNGISGSIGRKQRSEPKVHGTLKT